MLTSQFPHKYVTTCLTLLAYMIPTVLSRSTQLLQDKGLARSRVSSLKELIIPITCCSLAATSAQLNVLAQVVLHLTFSVLAGW